MGARRRPRSHPQGRRTRLMEPGMHDRLVDRARAGVPVAIAAESVGIAVRTFTEWMQRGHAEQERLADLRDAGEEHPEPDPYERPFLDLYEDVMEARSQAAVRNVGNVQRAANGGFVTEETTRKYRDDDGNLVEETTIKRAAPDWRAAAWYLERQHRTAFGREATQVEVTGKTELTMSQSAEEALSARLAENIAALAIAATPHDPNDVVDAELVDEPAT